MTLDEQTEIVKKITRTLSIMMCDIRLHQSMNMFSLNIHAEDFFCNVFNFLYVGKKFKNANAANSNEAYIDLIDNHSKHMIQVTTTTGKSKIDNSLKIFESHNPIYMQYEFEIFYLLDKPKGFNKDTIAGYNDAHGIEDIREHLKDYTDLINEIKLLDHKRLQSIYDLYFKGISEKLTDEVALQIVFESLAKRNHTKVIDYSVDFRKNIPLEQKIEVNDLHIRVSGELHKGSEASLPIYENVDCEILKELQTLVVDGLYTDILKEELSKIGATIRDLARKSSSELHQIALTKELNFSAVLGLLCHRIKEKTFEASYQETSMAWVIIAYFFEECDIGMKQ
ncbi:SMEK domain-containing protein [Vibrio splendidus]